MPTFRGDILKGHTPTVILSLLEAGPRYGLEISREVSRRSGGSFRFGEGLLYPALHQLESKRLVTSEWRLSHHGPRRKYYRLTPLGRREGKRLRRHWQEFSLTLGGLLETAAWEGAGMTATNYFPADGRQA
jgi:PadR family transcriptional regulator, regulatory protein PadR